MVRLFSFLIPKSEVPVQAEVDGIVTDGGRAGRTFNGGDYPACDAKPVEADDLQPVPLVKLAWGVRAIWHKANIGIIARDAAYLPYIWVTLDEASGAALRAFHGNHSTLERYLLPGSHAINFPLQEALGGGGVASLRNDPQGKAYAQILLTIYSCSPSIAEAV